MKHCVLLGLVIFALFNVSRTEAKVSCEQKTKLVEVSLLWNKMLIVKNSPSGDSSLDGAERRGCCSHHGGVCGCSNGRALCCDTTLSPSCGCD